MKITVKPRYVDSKKCVGCGVCSRLCPVEIPSTFDEGLSKRKAIYLEFPQAIPRVPTIDRASCLHFRDPESCDSCFQKCPTKAIDFNQKEVEIDTKVGAIIVSTGFNIYGNLLEYGLNRSRNVITGMQLERLVSPFGPTGGKIVRLSDGSEPKNSCHSSLCRFKG
ncbi:MAG: 4Fe-4S dicluster domain-containing protein [Thermoproteota archaeon]